MASSAKVVAGVSLIILLLVIIGLAIFLFISYRNKSFIFTKYTPPEPPSPYFYPLGSVRPLTQEEIDQRNKIIMDSVNTVP